MQFAYKVECMQCGRVYGANGSDMHERRCPEGQSGAPGIPYWIMPPVTDAEAELIREQIAIGVEQARAGQLSDGPAYFARLREKVEEGLRQADASQLTDHADVHRRFLD